MKKKSKGDFDIVEVMTKIQEQLAVLDQKLDTFMTKSLTELAQALAASKPAAVRQVPVSNQMNNRVNERSSRPLYRAVCADCRKDCEIPFKPSGDRPVFCQECFAIRKSHSPKAAEIKSPVVSTATVSVPTAAASIDQPVKKKKKAASRKSMTKKKVKKK